MGSFISISDFSSLVVATAAAITAFYAFKGVSEWRNRLRVEVEYKIARELLESVYRFRDCIASIRTAFTPYVPALEEEHPGESQASLNFLGIKDFYEERYKNIGEARLKLYAPLLQAEVLWGAEVRNFVDELVLKEKLFILKLKNYIATQDPKLGDLERDSLEASLRGFEIFEVDDKDKFSAEFGLLVKQMEGFLKPKLNVK